MKANKILLGGVVGGVIFFLLGWLIYGMLLTNFTTANFNQCAARPMEEMIMWSMVLSNLAYGFLLSIVLGWSKPNGVFAGALTGGVVGLLISISIDFSMYSMSKMFLNFSAVLVDIILYTLMSAIAGLFIALVFGAGRQKA